METNSAIVKVRRKARVEFDVYSKGYEPGRILDELKKRLDARNDNELAMTLGIEHAVISKIRNRKVAISAHCIVRFLDATHMTIDEFRRIAGMPSELKI